ncbi:MAG: J domain-containing protein [Pseudogulbenkiania sp.]|nr:J domain-containing protein [Pseudogulbenkiania sp.]
MSGQVFMGKLVTHYDNLNVSRDAPQEVIKAAYCTLQKKYHPDLHQGSLQTAQRMLLIQRAYEVLSDPELRRAHDEWIDQEEQAARRAEAIKVQRQFQAQQSAKSQTSTSRAATAGQPRRTSRPFGPRLQRHFEQNWHYYLAITGLVYIVVANEPGVLPERLSKPYLANPASQPPASPLLPGLGYQRAATTPYGYGWPTGADYLAGAPQVNNDGLSTVTVDNSQTSSDFHVKMVFLDAPQAYPAREFYIPAHATFTMEQVRAGHYDLRYRNLETGVLTRSDPISVQQQITASGNSFQHVRVTLYSMVNGNMQTHQLNEKDF